MLLEAACETAAAAFDGGGFGVGDLLDGFALAVRGAVVGGWCLALFDGGGVGVGGVEFFRGRGRARGFGRFGGGAFFGGFLFDVLGVCRCLSVKDGRVT